MDRAVPSHPDPPRPRDSLGVDCDCIDPATGAPQVIACPLTRFDEPGELLQ